MTGKSWVAARLIPLNRLMTYRKMKVFLLKILPRNKPPPWAAFLGLLR
jgi:hypothetical protein